MFSSSAKAVRMPLEWCLSRSGRPQVAGVSANSFSDPTMMQQQQLRWKHSSTQIKRIFRNHPARARVEGRMGVDRTPATLPEPQFGAVFEPLLLPNGWSAPPGAQVQVPAYPFHILRTKNKPNDAVGFLPVYSKFRKDGTKATTRIRKVTGDQAVFLNELRCVLNLPAPKNGNPRDDAMRIRVGGTIEVEGNHVREVKEWLAGLGF